MTLHRPAHEITLPDIFPLKTTRRGSHSPASIADKRALFEYAFWQRLNQAETARAAGVSPSTIVSWKKSVLLDKGRDANRMDQKALRLVATDVPAAATAREEPATTDRAEAPQPAAARHSADWHEADIRKLLDRMRDEGLSNRQAAEIAGTTTRVISGWRRDLGVAGRRYAPSDLTVEEKVALLTRQRDEGLSNRATASLAGVHEETITVWRKAHGFAGRRGRAPAMSDADKEALFALKDEEGLTDRQLGDLAGVTAGTISIWRAAINRRAETPDPGIDAPRRRLVLERLDGSRVELEVTEDEVRRLLGLGPAGS